MCGGDWWHSGTTRAQTVMQQLARQTLLFSLLKAERDYSTSYSKIRLLRWRNELVLSDERTQHKVLTTAINFQGPFIKKKKKNLCPCVKYWTKLTVVSVKHLSKWKNWRGWEGKCFTNSQTGERLTKMLKKTLLIDPKLKVFLLKLSSCQYFLYFFMLHYNHKIRHQMQK